MKICLLSRAPFLGGAEVACERLAVGLAEQGHQVAVVLGERNEVYERLSESGISCWVYRLPLRNKTEFASYMFHWLRLWQFLRTFKPDLVHSNDFPTHQFVSSVACAIRIPRICHHRFIYDTTCIDWLNRKGAECHLFVSEFLMKLLSNRSIGLSKELRHVIYDGLPLGERNTKEARTAARMSLGLPNDKRIVLFAGQVIERKGVRELLDAWKMIESRTAGAELIIVGDDIQNRGEYRNAMQAHASHNDISARFVGFQKDVSQWLRAADVAVVPSREEPLGNATLEAMAAGLPVIGTRTGGIPEMIVDGETGLLVSVESPFELSQAIVRLITDSSLCRSLGESARLRCETLFSLDTHIESVVQVYSRLLSRTYSPKSR